MKKNLRQHTSVVRKKSLFNLTQMVFLGLFLALGTTNATRAQSPTFVEEPTHSQIYEQGQSKKDILQKKQRLQNLQRQLEQSSLRAGNEKRSFYQDGLRWEITDEAKKEVTLIRLLKDDEDTGAYNGTPVIPSAITFEGNSYTVTGIGRLCFLGRKITAVTLPETLKNIAPMAFAYTGITEIHIPDLVEFVGESAFENCSKALRLYIGKNVREVGKNAFLECWYLKEITLGEDNPIFSLRDGILYNKNQTEVLQCPPYRKEVNLLTLPKTVKKIAPHAFEYCFYFKEINLNEGVQEIGQRAFFQVFWLQKLHIPASVEKIEDGSAFSYLKGCTSLTVDAANKHYKSVDNRLYDISGETLIVHPYGAPDSATVNIPEGTKRIGAHAFEYCRPVKVINLPQSVAQLGECAFSECGIASLSLPEKIKELPSFLFLSCPNLKFLYLGGEVQTIGMYSLTDCKQLAHIQLKAKTPPTFAPDKDGDPTELPEKYKETGLLEVLPECVEAYKKAEEWKLIQKIVGNKNLSINETSSLKKPEITISGQTLSIHTSSPSSITLYTLLGEQVAQTMDNMWTIKLEQGTYLLNIGGEAHKIQIR